MIIIIVSGKSFFEFDFLLDITPKSRPFRSNRHQKTWHKILAWAVLICKLKNDYPPFVDNRICSFFLFFFLSLNCETLRNLKFHDLPIFQYLEWFWSFEQVDFPENQLHPNNHELLDFSKRYLRSKSEYLDGTVAIAPTLQWFRLYRNVAVDSLPNIFHDIVIDDNFESYMFVILVIHYIFAFCSYG